MNEQSWLLQSVEPLNIWISQYWNRSRKLKYIWSSRRRWNLDSVLRLIYRPTFLSHFNIGFTVLPLDLFLYEKIKDKIEKISRKLSNSFDIYMCTGLSCFVLCNPTIERNSIVGSENQDSRFYLELFWKKLVASYFETKFRTFVHQTMPRHQVICQLAQFCLDSTFCLDFLRPCTSDFADNRFSKTLTSLVFNEQNTQHWHNTQHWQFNVP